MPFNADAFVEAMEPPAIVIKGKTHMGRLLSQREFEKLFPKFTQWSVGDVKDPTAEMKGLLKEMGFKEEAVEAIMGLPPGAISAAMLDFFLAHNRSGKIAAAPPAGQTSGNSSPQQAAAPPPEGIPVT